MMFLKSYTPNKVVDKVIQYNYKDLHIKFGEVARNKMIGRQERSFGDQILRCKVVFEYDKIDFSNIPLKWVKVWNMLSYPNKIRRRSQALRVILQELGVVNIRAFLYSFLVSHSMDSMFILDKIYDVLLSTL